MNWWEILLIINSTIIALTNLGCFIVLFVDLLNLLKKIKMDKKMENIINAKTKSRKSIT